MKRIFQKVPIEASREYVYPFGGFLFLALKEASCGLPLIFIRSKGHLPLKFLNCLKLRSFAEGLES